MFQSNRTMRVWYFVKMKSCDIVAVTNLQYMWCEICNVHCWILVTYVHRFLMYSNLKYMLLYLRLHMHLNFSYMLYTYICNICFSSVVPKYANLRYMPYGWIQSTHPLVAVKYANKRFKRKYRIHQYVLTWICSYSTNKFRTILEHAYAQIINVPQS